MNKSDEINRGYINYMRATSAAVGSTAQVNPNPASRWLRSVTGKIGLILSTFSPFLVLVALLITSTVVLIFLKISTVLRRQPLGRVHAGAIDKVNLFVPQYPFQLYPTLCKSLELAFLQQEIPKIASKATKIVELAIGDGSLSEKVYPPGSRITAVDISPFSLRFPAAMPHVERAVISDCLNPAIASGTFDLLVSNNFLHHVSAKEAVLDHIARIANHSIFNENTTYWASAWPKPFVLGRLGLRGKEKAAIDAITTRFLQDLKPREELDEMVSQRFVVETEESYLCESTFFLCGIFSRLMGVYGPPAPGYMKRMAQAPVLGSIISASTRALAVALIRYDNTQDKATAAFVSYSCKSKTFEKRRPQSELICAACQGELTPACQCTRCGTQYPQADGMSFVLPADLMFIHANYVAHTKQFYEKESLHQHH